MSDSKAGPHRNVAGTGQAQLLFLSDLKFAGMRSATGSRLALDQKKRRVATAQYSVQDPAQPQIGIESLQADGAPIRQNFYDRLASDKPGEELAPDSSIWRLYAAEAKEHDNDLVAGRDRNLDTMLLFAGLFSAILTAFLVESTNMLGPNLAETSTMLLLNLAQSQRRVEIGAPDLSSPPVDLPSFKPAALARSINTLWFMALALSLGAAMMAMLAKEWLDEFIASPPRHPYEYALERQARLEALISWNTIRIIDFLPTLLHFSLVLFTLGLIMHLWLLDRVIAMIITGASSVLTMSYITVVILGAAKDRCPYQTQVSKYIRKLLYENKQRVETTPASHQVTRSSDLNALRWLSINARDPAIGDSAYQALAGLQSRKIRGWSPKSEETPEVTTEELVEDHRAVLSMGTEILNRLSNALVKYPRELAFCRGTNAARYAGALPEIYHYAYRYMNQNRMFIQAERSHNNESPSKLEDMARGFQCSAFDALDKIWSDDCPPFTADSYARLTAAELRLTGCAITETCFDSIESTQEMEGVAPLPHTSVNLSTDLLHAHTGRVVPVALADLRIRCSRALCRAAFQILFHSNGRAPISNFALINLLEAISELAKKEGRDPNKALIAYHEQNPSRIPIPIAAFITGTSGYRVLDPLEIGDEDGMLAGLTKLLGSNSVKALPKVEVAALNAMAAVGPKLIKQWLHIQSNSPSQKVEQYERYSNPSLCWQPLETFGDSKFMLQARIVNMPRTKCAIAYLLEVSHFAIFFFKNPGIWQLPDIALRSLYNRASTPPSARAAAHEIIAPRVEMLAEWIDSVGRAGSETQIPGERIWSQEAKTCLLRLLAIENQDTQTIFDLLLMHMREDEHGAENNRLFTVLEIMGTISGCRDDVKRLLENVSACVQESYDGNYSQCFTTTSEGFHCLQKVGSYPEYAEPVAQTIMSLVADLAEKHSDGAVGLESDAISGFLDAVSFVCRHPPSRWAKSSNSFIMAVISTLQRFDSRLITPYLSVRGALDDLKAASEQMSNGASKARFLSAQTEMEADVRKLSRLVEVFSQGVYMRGRSTQ